jgi:hypothetical protein
MNGVATLPTRLRASRAETQRRRTWSTIAGGTLLGAAWGIVARIWMRYISEDPEFTWGGTLSIMVGPTLIGLAMGVVRSRPRPRWSKLFGCVSPLLIGIGAGIIMLPTIVLAAIALGRTTMRRWSRALLVLVAAVPVGAVLIETDHLGFVRRGAAMLWYLLLCWWLSAMVAVSYRPRS